MSLWSPSLSHSKPYTIRGSYFCFCLSPTASLHARPCAYTETLCPLGHPVSGAGCSRTVAPFSATPVQGARPSPRLCHVHLPAQGCPHLPCPPGALNNSSLPAVPPGVLCTYPATESVWTWQSLYTQFHFICDVAPVLPFVSCVPGVMLLCWPRLPTPETHCV